MAIVYNGTTFSGSNSSQNVYYNGTNMCNVVQWNNNGRYAVPVYSRGEWYITTGSGENRFHSCIYRIDSDGEIYVCWWVDFGNSFNLLHPSFSFNSDVKLPMFMVNGIYTYDTAGYIGRPKIIIEGISGECEGCMCICTLNTSQWNPSAIAQLVSIRNSPSSTESCLWDYSTSCCGTFRFYFNDRSIGRCWYYHYGAAQACSDSYASFTNTYLCFTDDDRNGVLRNCVINYGRWTPICA